MLGDKNQMSANGTNRCKYSSNFRLCRILNVTFGLLYAVSLNLKTEDGLFNGLTCPVKNHNT